MASERVTTAAGGVIWRKHESGLQVQLIHRPEYDDWTFPKGKTDPGESLQQTAVREIAEEAGLQVRLGLPLPRVDYRTSAGPKQVSYWCARVVAGSEDGFVANREVDTVRWLSVGRAADRLTYDHDRTLLSEFDRLRRRRGHRTRTLVVLRHGKAVARAEFAGDDLDRPLARAGTERARGLVAILGAYGVKHVATSPALRCTETVAPYAHAIGADLRIDDRLAEGAGRRSTSEAVAELLDRKKPVALCSHQPSLPTILDAIGADPVDLSPGEGVVVHHRKGHVLATERLRLPD